MAKNLRARKPISAILAKDSFVVVKDGALNPCIMGKGFTYVSGD